MNHKKTTAIHAIASLAIMSMIGASGMASAEGYKYANGVVPMVTFEFKDGTEVHEFPVFVMEDDFVENRGSPGFTLTGVIGDSPHLHKMLDTAFKHKHSNAHEWNYQYAGITIDFMKDGAAVRTLQYHDCEVEDYKVTTLADDQEAYVSSKTGFALVDQIEFLCSGLNPSSPSDVYYAPGTVSVYGTDFDYYNNIRSFVEFEFDQGVERIEFPYFELQNGFKEDLFNVTPEFKVEGVVGDYPLLHKAIDNARGIKGIAAYSNIDFEAHVQFIRHAGDGDNTVLRELDFGDCRATSYKIKTLFDKEEGFTGKSGFAQIEEIGFACISIDGINPRYSDVHGDGLTWRTPYLTYDAPDSDYSSAGSLNAAVTFEYDYGQETSIFPVFKQGDVLGLTGLGSSDISVPPTFELSGEISDLPMLYEKADENLALSFTTGANNFLDLFNVDVQIVEGKGAYAEVLRGFEYNECRITDYSVKTIRDKEESYFKGFAHSNTFDFECLGYHPYNPLYDAMLVYEKPTGLYTSVEYQRDQTERTRQHPLFR